MWSKDNQQEENNTNNIKTCLCGLRDSWRRETGCILCVTTEAGWTKETNISYRRI